MIEACGRELRISNPDKVFFPERGFTKLDLVHYYLACEEAVVRHLAERPSVLKRWVDGVAGKPFFQKRVPDGAPEWLQTATVTFPSGRHARELVVADGAHLAWGVNLGVIDWNPWPVRRADLDHPDELRIDLDPGPEVAFAEVREVALGVREVLEEHGLRGYPKTSGSRGMHVYVRIVPEHDFTEVRRAALALAREVERRHARARDQPLVEGGARGRVHRLQPERPRPHRRLGLLGARGPRRARVLSAGVGGGPRRRARRPAHRDRPRALARARRPVGDASTTRPASSTRCWSWPRATSARGSATRPGRRTSASSAPSPAASSPAARAQR